MPTVVDLSALGSSGFTLQDDGEYDRAGYSVSDAGDVNGDGIDDIIVGTRVNGAYVIFGRTGGFGTIDLGNLLPADGFLIQGGDFHYPGVSVAAAGDINGDGFDDVVVGGFYYSYYYGSDPTAYVIFGKGSGFGTIDVSDLAASDGFTIQSEFHFYDFSGLRVDSAGDINGDGFDDLIVSSPYDNGSAGAAYVIFGKASGFADIDLTNLSSSVGFEIAGAAGLSDLAGWSVAGAGDVNGDGFDDLIVGAPGGDSGGTNSGQAYVLFGKASGFTTIDLGNLAGAGFLILGDFASDSAGFSVAGAGDVNGDGIADIIVGAHSNNDAADDAGEAYVIFGKASGLGTIDLSNLGAGGFTIQGDAVGDHAGWSVAGAGDINADGFDDIIVGAPFGDDGGTHAGEAYVIFGKPTGFGTIDLTNLSPADGFIIRGDATEDRAGWSVSAAGDINGDGVADLIVGAPYGDNGANAAGEAYVIFGSTAFENYRDVANDFDGDGRSDVLWRNSDGIVTDWLGQINGTFIGNTASFTAGSEWGIEGTGDFDGDGEDDILWRNDAGIVRTWLGQANGTFIGNTAYFTAGSEWGIAGTGDFNGDGEDDILWRNEASGIVTSWLGQENGTFVGNASSFVADNSWAIVGTGDFNGDNRDDVLWRNEASGIVTTWLGQANGTFIGNTASFTAGNEWQVQPDGNLL